VEFKRGPAAELVEYQPRAADLLGERAEPGAGHHPAADVQRRRHTLRRKERRPLRAARRSGRFGRGAPHRGVRVATQFLTSPGTQVLTTCAQLSRCRAAVAAHFSFSRRSTPLTIATCQCRFDTSLICFHLIALHGRYYPSRRADLGRGDLPGGDDLGVLLPCPAVREFLRDISIISPARPALWLDTPRGNSNITVMCGAVSHLRLQGIPLHDVGPVLEHEVEGRRALREGGALTNSQLPSSATHRGSLQQSVRV
jgi:hypothetical protein